MACADVVVVGGGVAGLWVLDELVRAGHEAVLLENSRLGCGQTVVAQGIIHGGLKYSLSGTATGSALGIQQMPEVWTECLAGRRDPDLRQVAVRSRSCLLWRGRSLGSRLGVLGARLGLEVTPRPLEDDDRPAVLADHPGPVAVMDEPVIDPVSLLESLADRHRHRLFPFFTNQLQDFCRASTMSFNGNNIFSYDPRPSQDRQTDSEQAPMTLSIYKSQ